MPDVQRIETSPYSSVPGALITEHGVETAAGQLAPAGWLIESSSPITDAQLSAAREMAAASGLSIESRDTQAGLATLRSAAAAVGIAVALAILAMTIGLIRAETAGDVRTLTAVGASSRTRRRVTAATPAPSPSWRSSSARPSAYAAVFAGYTPETGAARNIPVTHLVIVAVGFPLRRSCGVLAARRTPAAPHRPAAHGMRVRAMPAATVFWIIARASVAGSPGMGAATGPPTSDDGATASEDSQR